MSAVALALDALQGGLTIRQAADLSTLDVVQVWRVGARAGLIVAPSGRMVPPEQLLTPLVIAAPAVHIRGRAVGGRAAAALHDYPARAVRSWARRSGVECPTRGRYLPAALVEAWRAAGAPQ